jgi:hypothetical protein
MTAAWFVLFAGLAMIAWNRRIARALDARNRAIADFLRLPFLRRWAYKPWWYAYNRVALVLAGLMWAAGGAAILILSLFFRIYS